MPGVSFSEVAGGTMGMLAEAIYHGALAEEREMIYLRPPRFCLNTLHLGLAVRLVLAVGVQTAIGAPLHAQTLHSVDVKGAGCDTCRIQFRSVARLGSREGKGSLPDMPIAVALDARRRFWVVARGGTPPMLFDSAGAFLQVVGRRGEGPGEFTMPHLVVPAGGDSIVVLDGPGRATVLSADLRPARYVFLPAAFTAVVPLDWPGAVWASGSLPTPARAGLPIHVVSFADKNAAIVRSLSPADGSLVPGHRTLIASLARAQAGGIWVAEMTRYRVTRWDTSGKAEQTIERRPDWFRNTSAETLGGPAVPPRPMLTAAYEDERGRLWIYARVPATNWRSAWPKLPAGATELASRSLALEKLYSTRVDVLDASDGRLLASRLIDAFIFTVLTNGTAVTYTTDEVGTPFADVLSFSVRP